MVRMCLLTGVCEIQVQVSVFWLCPAVDAEASGMSYITFAACISVALILAYLLRFVQCGTAWWRAAIQGIMPLLSGCMWASSVHVWCLLC